MDYFDITKTKLVIPNLWDKDWKGVIEESGENEKLIFQAQCRAANLLKNIEDYSFSFKRAAWLNLWTRLFNILEGTKSAISCNSELILEILERMLFEYTIQVCTIAETNQGERLKAFSAWCLYNDYKYQESLLSSEIMDGIWDIEEEKDLLENESKKQFHEKLFAPLFEEKLMTDFREAEKNKFSHKSQEYKKLGRIEHWFNNDEIKPWIQKIKSLKDWNPSFFQLFDKNQKSFFKRLKAMKFNDKDLKFAYIIYKRASMNIHGSSFHNPFTINPEMLFPNFTGSKNKVTDIQKHIGKSCYDICVMLTILRQYAWAEQTS